MKTPFFKDIFINLKSNRFFFESTAVHLCFEIHIAFLPALMKKLQEILLRYESQLNNDNKEWFTGTSHPYEIKFNNEIVVFQNVLDNEVLEFPYILLPFFFEKVKAVALLTVYPNQQQLFILGKIKNSTNPEETLRDIVFHNSLLCFLQQINCESYYSIENHFFLEFNYELLKTWANLLAF